MGKTFVEDERPCDSCVNRTRYGCVSWNCEYINRDEAIKAWREKNEKAERKTEPTISKMEQVDKDINVRCKDEPQRDCGACEHSRITCRYMERGEPCEYEPKDEPQTDCGDFADRLAYERGVKHAWEVAQKVFDSTVTFYEAEDVAKQIAKTEPQTDCAWK